MTNRKSATEHINLAQVVREHGPWLLRWLESRLPPGIDADDLAQEVFLTLHRNWARVRDPERLGPYLYRAAKRLRSRAIQNFARRIAIESEAELTAQSGEDGTALDNEQLEEAIRALPDDLAQAVAAYYTEGGSYEEVAARLGLPRPTLQSRLRRGLEKLRGLLGASARGESQ